MLTRIVRFEHPRGLAAGAPRRRRKAVKFNPRRRTRSRHYSATVPPARASFLIEYLHLIQDTYKQISAAHLAALGGRNAAGLRRGVRNGGRSTPISTW